jgi:hypothetical protein
LSEHALQVGALFIRFAAEAFFIAQIHRVDVGCVTRTNLKSFSLTLQLALFLCFSANVEKVVGTEIANQVGQGVWM